MREKRWMGRSRDYEISTESAAECPGSRDINM